MAEDFVIEMLHITKEFPGIKANDDITLQLRKGEVHALLGENGASKSTLMNILGGVLPADRGEIVIDGAAVHFRTPSDSLSAGVAFIHQELSLINDLAIYENMFIGRELKTKYGLLDAKTMIQKTQEVFDRLEQLGSVCVNATCPNVVHIQELVSQAEQEGRHQAAGSRRPQRRDHHGLFHS